MPPHGTLIDQYYPVDDIDGRDEDLHLAIVALGCAIKKEQKKEKPEEDLV